jgi:hypothetical protein
VNIHSSSLNLAVLIDADNTSFQVAEGLFDEIAKIGAAGVRRIYGDFTSTYSQSWVKILTLHGLVPQQQFPYTKNKNASDITLVIDAMDLLHKGGIDGFCIVSSDSDFTRLASRIREEGVAVFGFGGAKTPESFRQACTRFIYTENLLQNGKANNDTQNSSKKYPPSKAVPLLHKALAQAEHEDGWAHLGGIGTLLSKIAPDFDVRTYGSKQLSELVTKTGVFDIQKNGQQTVIRAKKTK